MHLTLPQIKFLEDGSIFPYGVDFTAELALHFPILFEGLVLGELEGVELNFFIGYFDVIVLALIF